MSKEDRKSPQAILNQFFNAGSKPTPQSFPELPQCVIWMRCFCAILYGVYLGVNDRMGAINMIFGMNIVAFFPVFYCQWVLLADGDVWENKLVFAGIPNAAGMMLLVWIFVFSQAHESEEVKFMAKMVIQQASQRLEDPPDFADATIVSSGGAAGVGDVVMEDAAAAAVPEPVVEEAVPEESEF